MIAPGVVHGRRAQERCWGRPRRIGGGTRAAPREKECPADMIIIAHRILIGTAICFGIFFTGWEVVRYRQTGHLENAIVAVIAAAVTVAMAYYLKNLKRFVGR
jgi:hypothetical protein